jgi:hypothetical protein
VPPSGSSATPGGSAGSNPFTGPAGSGPWPATPSAGPDPDVEDHQPPQSWSRRDDDTTDQRPRPFDPPI